MSVRSGSRGRIAPSEPDDDDLQALATRASGIRDRWMAQAAKRKYGEEDLRPIVVEFAGSPRAGKSSAIEIVEHFFRRSGFRVFAPAEGASKRTPRSLKGNLVVYNAWSLNYAISELLTAFYSRDRPNIILLDRGPFDALAWFRYLEREKKLSAAERARIEQYALQPTWSRLIDVGCLMTCSPEQSLERERSKKLTHSDGIAMNPKFLPALLKCYESVKRDLRGNYDIRDFDTSEHWTPRAIAYDTAKYVLELAHRRLLDDETASASGRTVAVVALQHISMWMGVSKYWTDSRDVSELQTRIAQHHSIAERSLAEGRSDVVQLIAHALVTSGRRYLCLQRSPNDKRPELRGKLSLLFGGHVEGGDSKASPELLEACLRRELSEELQLKSISDVRQLGFVTDTTSAVGRTHLGCVFKVGVPESTLRVSASADLSDYFATPQKRELQMQSTDWIAEHRDSLDPWSRLVFDGLSAGRSHARKRR